MKKNLIRSLVFILVLSITGTVLAAPENPFGDVPVKHWSYDSVSKLVEAGIIDGYGDKTFRGDKTLTRYEMSQLVARAMWNADKADAENRAVIDKLSKEYASELESLGVKVSKQAKKASGLVMSGDARLRWIDDGSGNTKFAERFRINMSAEVNADTSFYGRIVALNHNELGTYKTSTDNDRLNVADAAFTTRNFYGTTVTVGRFSQQMDPGGYWMNTTGGVDGIKVTAGNKLKVTAGFANFGPYSAMQKGNSIIDPVTGTAEIKDAFFTQAVYPLSDTTTVGGWWFKEETGEDSKFDVKSIHVTTKLSPDFTLATGYGKNYIETNGKKPTFQQTRLTYGAVSPAKAGSWSLAAEFRKFEPGVNNSIYTTSMVGSVNDAKGWGIIGSMAVARNITFTTFYGFNAKKVSTNADIDNYTRCQIDYLF
ncbi:S-layer homology domain-containing protein [Sporomusa sp.]|uniref:S-layer homology domain-containing protein n=1 Tax=Sporomusa sp. TaxID=2078658 RepID=UPI002B5813AC|nr:S-layer homology domain-containing protein [Sporomusa sp.]HWR06318.1 S-layer homology domain-containing protein [Sporomusa sp.]